MSFQPDPRWYTSLGYERIEHAARCYAAFQYSRDEVLLDDAIDLSRASAAETTDDRGLGAAHYLLGTAYRTRSEITGSLDDMTWALRSLRQSLDEDPAWDRYERLLHLSTLLLSVVEMLNPDDDMAIQHLDLIDDWLAEAEPGLPPVDEAMCHSIRGLAQLQRSRHTGLLDHWNASYTLLTEATSMAPDDISKAACCGNLGKALAMRYWLAPEAKAAAAAVAAFDEAARVSPRSDPNHDLHLYHQRVIREQLGLAE